MTTRFIDLLDDYLDARDIRQVNPSKENIENQQDARRMLESYCFEQEQLNSSVD